MATVSEGRRHRLPRGIQTDHARATFDPGHFRERGTSDHDRDGQADSNVDGHLAPAGIDWGFLLYFYLHMAGFLATTLLITWGLFVCFFLAIGGLSVDGMMHQLHNMASRYVAADAVRTASFRHVLIVAHTLLSAAVIFFRRNSMLPARDPKRSTPNG